METDFRAFFLLVETIIEIRQNPFFLDIPANGSLFLLGKTDFLASENHIFFIFQGLLPAIVFFPLVEKYFSTNSIFRLVEMDFLESGNCFLPLRGNRP